MTVRATTLLLERPEQEGLVGWESRHGRYVVVGVGPRGPHAVVGEGQSCGCWGFWRGQRRFALVVVGVGDGEGGVMLMVISVVQLCHSVGRVERHC